MSAALQVAAPSVRLLDAGAARLIERQQPSDSPQRCAKRRTVTSLFYCQILSANVASVTIYIDLATKSRVSMKRFTNFRAKAQRCRCACLSFISSASAAAAALLFPAKLTTATPGNGLIAFRANSQINTFPCDKNRQTRLIGRPS